MNTVEKPCGELLEQRVNDFRADLRRLEMGVMVQKYLTYGSCALFTSDTYFELKRQVADQFGLHPSEVLVVGSAKLGFSIAPTKRYTHFNDQSDIDVALVAPHLFEQIWAEVYEYKQSGAYWDRFNSFCQYLFEGWIRPDKLPPSSRFSRAMEWWEYFRVLTNSAKFGPFKIRAGLYKSWRFLEGYQQQCVAECKQFEL